MRVKGKARRFASPREAIAAGLALCPEDRKDEGIVPLLSVRENLVLAERNAGRRSAFSRRRAANASRRPTTSPRSRSRPRRPKRRSARCPAAISRKSCSARWLAAGADILLMDEPTRGIDVGARSEIYALLFRLAEEGKTILVASSDTPEILGLCDRVIVMREGRIAGELAREAATQDALLRLALPDGARGGGGHEAGA